MATMDNSLHYTSVNHAYHLIGAINQLRRNSELCDITLNCGTMKIPAHKLILSVSSPYFKSLMSLRPQIVNNVTEIHLNGIDSDGVSQIIEFFYTSAISVTEENVWSLLPAASLLQSEEIQNLCCDFLSSQLQAENCLRIHKVATQCLCSALLSETTDYIKANFEKVLEEEVFLELGIEDLIEHLKRMNEVVFNNEQLLQAVKCWIIHSIDDRQSHGLKIINEFPKLAEKLQDFIPLELMKEGKRIRGNELQTDDSSLSQIDSMLAEVSSNIESSDVMYEDDNKVLHLRIKVVDDKGCLTRNVSPVSVPQHFDLDFQTIELQESAYFPNQDRQFTADYSSRWKLSKKDFDDYDNDDGIVSWIPVESSSTIEGSSGQGQGEDRLDESDEQDQTINKSNPNDLINFTAMEIEAVENRELQESNSEERSQGQSSSGMHYFCEWPGCTKSFFSKTGLKFHLNKHSNTYPYVCRRCNKGFNRAVEYEDHMNGHTGKVWKCSICGACPRTHHGRKVHESQHKRPEHRCDICGKLFTCREYLTTHRKAHTDEFKCMVCQKVFKRKHHYKEHIKVHDEDGFHCQLCNFVTNYRQSLKRHVRSSHNPNKSQEMSCVYCKQPFIRRDHLRKHEEKCANGPGDIWKKNSVSSQNFDLNLPPA